MSKLGNCPDCGLNMDLVGLRHRCIPNPVNNIKSEATQSIVINTAAQRQAKWRKANTELNRQRAREGMRKLREHRTNDPA